MRKTIGFLAAISLALPGFASAQASNADLQAQAQALLQQVAALQAQLAAQGGTVTNSTAVNAGAVTATQNGSVNSSACPNIGRVLKRGSSGDDVTRLQQFLALDVSVYPEGTISGYFGPLTEQAVQRWQAKYNIVSSGSSASTGYGVVGPRTAAAIALLCSTGSSSPVGGYIQVSPISGNAPLNVNVVATVNSTNSCAGAIYLLNWGDNTNPISIPVSAGNCQQLSQTYQHTYSVGGTYQITLSSGAHQTAATVTVFGSAPAPTPSPGPTPQGSGETFSATPTSGNAPLSVNFTGTVNGKDAGWCATGCSSIIVFGDGQQAAVPLPTSQNGSQVYAIQHIYSNAGTYTATLYQGQAGSGRPTVGSATITVGGGGSTSGTYNPPSLNPAYGGNPMSVQLSFEYPFNLCSNYTLTWGDGTNSNPPSQSCNGSTSLTTFTQNHTYSTGGNYTITLTRGNQVNTIGVNISN